MQSIVGTDFDDILIADESGDRLFGLFGNDGLLSDVPGVFMNGGSGSDELRSKVELDNVVDYSDVSFFKAGSGSDRVVLRTDIVGSEAFVSDGFPSLDVDHSILTESGDDWVFVENRLSGSDFTEARATTRLIDLIGDNQVIIKNVISTFTGFASAVTDIVLGRGDDTVRYEGDTTDFNSGAASTHVFDLGDGDNRLKYTDVTGELDFDLVSGSGRDVISIDYQIDDPNTIGLDGDFNISTGGGNDVVHFEAGTDSGLAQEVSSVIDLGDGNNFLKMTQGLVGAIMVSAGDGNDRLVLMTDGSSGFFGPESPFDITVDLGGGNNRVTLDLDVSGNIGGTDLVVITGDGRDRIEFTATVEIDDFFPPSVDPFTAQIDMGGGNDQIDIGFADLTLTTGEGSDIVRFDQSAITEPIIDEDALTALNPGQNTLILTDFDFEAGDQFIFTGFGADGEVTTLRSVADMEALVVSGGAIGLTATDGDLVLEVAGADDVTAQIIFEDLAILDTFAFL